MAPKDMGNPYADYTVQQMYDFLLSHTLRRDPGAMYEYSNLGMGLLGHALALRTGKSYELLPTERGLEPLGMRDTHITLTPSMTRRFAVPHDGDRHVHRTTATHHDSRHAHRLAQRWNGWLPDVFRL